MNLNTMWSRYQALKIAGAVSLEGFGEIRQASRFTDAIYLRVVETPAQLRLSNLSNNVQIKADGRWVDTGEQAVITPDIAILGTIVGVLERVGAQIGISIPVNDEAGEPAGSVGETGGASADVGGMVVPTVPVVAGAALGYYVGRSMGRGNVGALVGAVLGYVLGQAPDPSDRFDYRI